MPWTRTTGYVLYTRSMQVTCPTKKYLAYQIRRYRQPLPLMTRGAIRAFLDGDALLTLGLEDVVAVAAAKVTFNATLVS